MPKDRTKGELILYQTQEGTVGIEVFHESEISWLNQKKIAELFGVDSRTISEHLRNIFVSGELDEQAVLRKIRTTAADGKNYSPFFSAILDSSALRRLASARGPDFADGNQRSRT